MSAQELVPWFQMASTILAGVGIIVSVSLGIATLNNNRRDRIAKTSPNLLFNTGGEDIVGELGDGRIVPGKDKNDPDVKLFLKTRGPEARSIVLKAPFGQLFNHGAGTAFGVYIWFEPERVIADGHERWLTREELSSPLLTKDWNEIVAIPANLAPEKAAAFGILPGAVCFAGAQVSEMSGKMWIECQDSQGRSARWAQPVAFFINRREGEEVSMTITFGGRSLHL